MESRSESACLIIIGSEKTGKTTLANSLLGLNLLQASPRQNTMQPVVIFGGNEMSDAATAKNKRTHGGHKQKEITMGSQKMLAISLPHATLHNCTIVDTPANFTASSMHDLENTHKKIVPIMCSRATQILTASQISYWLSLPVHLRSTGILAVTFCDLLPDPTLDKVAKYISARHGELFPLRLYSGRSWNPPVGVASIARALDDLLANA